MNSWGFLEHAADMARRGEAFALATVVWRQGPSSGKEGSRAIITATGEVQGWIGGACAEPLVIREARRVIAEGVPRLLLLGPPEHFGGSVPEGMTFMPISCQSEGALEVYIEPAVRAPHLVIVGHSPMTRALAEMARALGWRAEAVADHDLSAADADRQSMVVVATQGHNDEDAVEQAVAARPAYLGLVGSARRGKAVLGYLAERGVPEEELARVHFPAGLDLGPTSHEEIAVAILAEIVKLRASGELIPRMTVAGTAGTGTTAGGATGSAVPAGQAAPVAAGQAAVPDEAVDPVCGMTVTAGRSSLSLEHDGVAYYFCSAHCRRAFENDAVSGRDHTRKETRC
jgi:xanthine dehydrogenase accessory factor